MTEYEDGMLGHMDYIVNTELRPFSYVDFLSFEVDGKEYKMAHGTIRNKFTKFSKEGLIEFEYYSIRAYYTLKGKKFGKLITPNPTSVSSSYNDPLCRRIQYLPFDKAAIHNIRLKFEVEGIYSILSSKHSVSN